MTVQVITGDCRDVLKTLPSDSVDCVVTSPPYFALRDYDAEGQMGLEASPDAFADELVGVFREVRRILRPEGTVWLNLGDTANNRRRIRSTSHQPSLNGFTEESWAEATKRGRTRLSINDGDLKEKDMCGVPWHTAFALRRDGWFLRQEIIWAKNFGKPEPSFDRLPSRHEQLFLLTKAKTYFFDRKALPAYAQGSVWQVAPTGRSDHGASFAPSIVEPCILAGCPVGGTVLDPFAGSGTTGAVASRLGRRAILIELHPDSAATARERIAADARPLAEFAGAA